MENLFTGLEPASLWQYFEKLNAVPRASKHESRVIQFIADFGRSLGLNTSADETGNVIIRKPAYPGMENRPTVVLQGHLDMVHQKNSGTDFDFANMGIKMFVDGDWVRARGTTLGADNGIGVSAIMAILASGSVPHPPIEALFTVDEETGMTGALGLQAGMLSGRTLLNLDTEDDTELTIGCAGGIDVTATGVYAMIHKPGQGFVISVKRLTGGHSGMDIHKGRANANKLMNSILTAASTEFDVGIIAIDGGGLRNAIPRESRAEICIDKAKSGNFEAWLNSFAENIKKEFVETDPALEISLEKAEVSGPVMHPDFQKVFLEGIIACPNGVYTMSPDIAGLVQTSNNLARIMAADGTYTIMCLTRSSVDSEKTELAEKISGTLKQFGAEIQFSGSYPGWTPDPNSKIVSVMRDIYMEKFSSEPNINACHAGLECGILGRNYPEMEMISFGPNIRGAHSPDECVQISSVQKFWDYLLETLKRI